MNEHITNYLRKIGRRGGNQTKRRGTAYYRAIGRQGAAKRWGNRTAPTAVKRRET